MSTQRIFYRFKMVRFDRKTFKGVSKRDLGITMKYLEKEALQGSFRQSIKFLIMSSYCTRLGVMDCFVN